MSLSPRKAGGRRQAAFSTALFHVPAEQVAQLPFARRGLIEPLLPASFAVIGGLRPVLPAARSAKPALSAAGLLSRSALHLPLLHPTPHFFHAVDLAV